MRIRQLNQPYAGPAYKPRLTKTELQHRLARQAAIERQRSKYIKLVCGHYQTLEEDERVSLWRPKKGVSYCDQCSDWVVIYVPPAVDNTPDEPMFLGWQVGRILAQRLKGKQPG